ncbi:hypothetical protein JT05_11200 [Desulfosporosinus sp. Tol-M]|jgi:hypothetical protein|nr:hypothetical protein JT05_11200 [Desulfosporosinus sp. Tol-M]
MRINYNVTGQERKALVAAISQELNAPTNYLGAPTFAYEVGGYHIDKNGVVTGPDNLDLESDLQGIHGFEAAEHEYDEPDTYESGLGGMGATPSIEELNDEAELLAEREMRRLKLENANVPDYSNRGPYGGDDIPAFEDLQMDGREELGLGRTHRENWQGENGMQASDVPEPDEPDKLSIEMPLSFMTDEGIANLEKLIASKAELIKKAIGADALPIERTETTLKFPWFKFPAESDEVSAYSRFIGALCAAAKKQKRVTAHEKAVDNEKYAFRCFLLRLGFIGDEYKHVRRILLKNLSGNSAFKSGTKKSAEVCDDVSK